MKLESLTRNDLGTGPIALIFAEDDAAVEETLVHHLALGFDKVVLFAPPGVEMSRADQRILLIDWSMTEEHSVETAVNEVMRLVSPGTWIYYGYNAEFLFFPFCDSRDVTELLRFHEEERRGSMAGVVVDLYSHIESNDFGIDLGAAYFDEAGYYGLPRHSEGPETSELDRQSNIFGGLRWRYEQHVPPDERRIDRVVLFKAVPGVTLKPRHVLSDDEMNTVSCPWHRNLTAAVCSFRAAKALRSNPASLGEVTDLLWSKSTPFEWSPQQLMDVGLMEPGQWF